MKWSFFKLSIFALENWSNIFHLHHPHISHTRDLFKSHEGNGYHIWTFLWDYNIWRFTHYSISSSSTQTFIETTLSNKEEVTSPISQFIEGTNTFYPHVYCFWRNFCNFFIENTDILQGRWETWGKCRWRGVYTFFLFIMLCDLRIIKYRTCGTRYYS